MPSIHQCIIISASAENVYNQLTTQEGLSCWWTPDTIAYPETGTIARFSFGKDYFKEMKITELTPHKSVEWLCISGASEWINTTMSFSLCSGNEQDLLLTHPEAAGQIQQATINNEATLVTFVHDNWKSYSPMFAECSYTWGQFLRSLKLSCETGLGKPWPNQHSL